MCFQRYIYFIPDPPHLLKTCRNNLINKNKHLWNNGIISVEPVKDLFRVSSKFFHVDYCVIAISNGCNVSFLKIKRFDKKYL